MDVTAARSVRVQGDLTAKRLRSQLAERDEIIVVLQHVIRDLQHDLENLRAAVRYGTFALDRPSEAVSRSDAAAVSHAVGDVVNTKIDGACARASFLAQRRGEGEPSRMRHVSGASAAEPRARSKQVP